MADSNFLLHLPLDELRLKDGGGYTTPELVANHHVTVNERPHIAYDDQLGGIMKFSGTKDSLEMPFLSGTDFVQGISITAWVRYDAQNSWSRIFEIGATDVPSSPKTEEKDQLDKGIFLANEAQSNHLVFQVQRESIKVENAFQIGEWFHLAATFDSDGNMAITINGTDRHENHKTNVFPKGTKLGWPLWRIAKSCFTHDGHFQGALAHLRLYNRSLTSTEIQSIMKTDRSHMASFRNTNPIDFDLFSDYNHDPMRMLFIEAAGTTEPLTLSMTNITDRSLKFDESIGDPGPANYHIQLRFRKQVLSPATLAQLRQKKMTITGWDYKASPAGTGGREEWISFVSTSALQLDKATPHALVIPGVSADARGGARNTRIEVAYNHLSNSGTQNAPFNGSVIRHLEIQSHLGNRILPMAATAYGTSTILNDGKSPNALNIKIENLDLTHSVAFTTTGANPSTPSYFELVMDKTLCMHAPASTKQAGLGTAITESDGNVHVLKFEVEGQANSYVIQVTNWITKGGAGQHNLVLRYRNIRGYQDGQWIIPVRLGPLVIRNTPNGENVGILTNNPIAPLDVNGDAIVQGHLLMGTDMDHQALEKYRKMADYSSDTNKSDASIWFLPQHANENDYATIRFFSHSGAAHKLEINVGDNEGDHLTLNSMKGRIGIGTTNPQEKLHLKGKLLHEGSFTNRLEDKTGQVMPVGSIIAYGGSNAPKGWLLCNGLAIPADAIYNELRTVLGKTITPDLSGRFVLGRKPNQPRHQTGGEEKVTLGPQAMPVHSHMVIDSGHSHRYTQTETNDGGPGAGYAGASRFHINQNNTNNKGTTASRSNIALGNAGGGQPHNNMPPYYILTYIIKY